MKVDERDELLGRLDERTTNTWNTIEEIKELIKEQNGRTRKLATKVNILWGIAVVLTGGTGFSLSQLIG